MSALRLVDINRPGFQGRHTILIEHTVIVVCFSHCNCHSAALLDRDMEPAELAELGPDGVLTPAQVESVVVDEIAGVLWRLVYLKKEDLSTEHVLEFAR